MTYYYSIPSTTVIIITYIIIIIIISLFMLLHLVESTAICYFCQYIICGHALVIFLDFLFTVTLFSVS